jgi:hypothetical protein
MTVVGHDPNRMYQLLPALYRIADAEVDGEPLRALLALVTEQADALRGDAEQMWDDFFVETCRPWVIPYIGDLVGNNPLHDLDTSAAARTAESVFTDLAGPNLAPPGAVRTRADVARTIYYRRRKGTPSMLEELARDVTGWGAHVVEFFTLLRWNQHLEHLRLDAHGCPELRRVDVGDRVGGAWDATAHTVDVRRINDREGWYNVPNLGVFLWRMGAYRLTGVTPRAIGGDDSWRRTFSPLGQDIPLFSAGRREPGASRLATELTVEAPIRAAAFFEDLRAAPPGATTTGYYGDPTTTEGSLVVVLPNGDRVPAAEVTCMNLRTWPAARPAGTSFWIDVTRGRLVVPDGRPAGVTVSYSHGFSAHMGGGEYPRRKWLVRAPAPTQVSGGGAALRTAVGSAAPGASTVIEVGDDATYELDQDITLAAGQSLTIQAADGTRPHVRFAKPGAGGAIAVTTTGEGSALTLGGLLVEGGLVVTGDLDTLRLLHTTLVPGRSVLQEDANRPSGPSVVVVPETATGKRTNTRLHVQIAFSIVGALRIPSHITGLWLLDSIVDGLLRDGEPPGTAIADDADADGPPAYIERSTILGTSRFRSLPMASESIFTGPVTVRQRQQGCVRFSYVPPGSQTPRQYRCQPSLEISTAITARRTALARMGIPAPPGWEQVLADEIATRLVPGFSALAYGRPAFGQLHQGGPPQIATGAEDGSEMGAFCVLKQPHRERNLRLRLDEYLPVGLDAGVIYVT